MTKDPFAPLPPFNVMQTAWAIYRDRAPDWRYRLFKTKHSDLMAAALRIAWDDLRMRQMEQDRITVRYGHLRDLSPDELKARMDALWREMRELEYYSRLPAAYDACAAEHDFIRWNLLPARKEITT
jgi:hypothetical protein